MSEIGLKSASLTGLVTFPIGLITEYLNKEGTLPAARLILNKSVMMGASN